MFFSCCRGADSTGCCFRVEEESPITLPPEIMDKVLETLKKYDRSTDGTIGVAEMKRIICALDTSDFWTEEKVRSVMKYAGADASGRIGLEQLCQSLEGSRSYEEVRQAIRDIMDSPGWDDGSYGPLLIRLAWHSSGTYSKADGSGGSNGATMRYSLEASDPENGGLKAAREYLEQVKVKFPWLSYSDLWVLAACVALEHTGGPKVPFRGGRVDAPESQAQKPGRLPGAEHGLEPGFELDEEGRLKGWEKTAQHIRDVFGRMGFSDKEAVALIAGGHVYGRCHTESSGYAGAWVENPTRFSNEYAADLVGDKWIAVEHDTKMPDGGPVPEEVRPAPGKRQYIDLSKYMPEEEEEAARQAPDATAFPPGRYRCASQWVNCRESPDVSSAIIGRFNQEEVLSLVAVKIFSTAVRGQTERGGWVSIVGSGGKNLFERIGGLDVKSLMGRYRAVASGGALYYSTPGGETTGRTKLNDEFCVSDIHIGAGGEILGKRADPGDGMGSWIMIFSPSSGLSAEMVIKGWNETPRKAILGQTGHQMMLVTDMCLLWDPGFREHVEVYAEDEELLKADFGKAFQRLTELGCAWSADKGAMSGIHHKMAASGCPVMGGN